MSVNPGSRFMSFAACPNVEPAPGSLFAKVDAYARMSSCGALVFAAIADESVGTGLASLVSVLLPSVS